MSETPATYAAAPGSAAERWEAARAWILSRPVQIRDAMRRFPPYCIVTAHDEPARFVVMSYTLNDDESVGMSIAPEGRCYEHSRDGRVFHHASHLHVVDYRWLKPADVDKILSEL